MDYLSFIQTSLASIDFCYQSIFLTVIHDGLDVGILHTIVDGDIGRGGSK